MRILFLTIAVFIMQQVQAQYTFHSLEEIWNYAESHSAQMYTAYSNQAIAGKGIDQAYGALLPSLGINGSFTDNIQLQPTLVPAELFGGEPGTYREEEFGKRYIYNAGITAQIDLINTQSWFSIKAARQYYETATLNVIKTRHELYNQLANAYYNYLLMNEASVLAKESLSIAIGTYETISGKYTEGLVNEVSLNTARINLGKTEMNLHDAIQNKHLALNNLKILLNLSVKDSVTLEVDTLVSAPALGQLSQDFPTDTEVGLAYSNMLAAKINWQSAKASYIPTLSAVYSAGKQLAGDNFFNFENTSNLPQQYWGLRLTIPILSGGTRAYQTARTRIELDTQQKVYESSLRSAQINDDNLILAYERTYSAYREARKILDLYRQNDSHADRKLHEGLISVDERLRVYQDFITYQHEYLQAVSRYFIQYYTIQVRQKTF
jgi:outer membrane protein